MLLSIAFDIGIAEIENRTKISYKMTAIGFMPFSCLARLVRDVLVAA